jgi:serine/threonine-protein kinase HipA
MNPCPLDVKRRIHALAIDELDATASLEIAFAVAPQFGLTKGQPQAIAGEVGAAVSKWRDVAKAYKLKPTEIDRMASAFDHDDLKRANKSAGGRAVAVAAKNVVRHGRKR